MIKSLRVENYRSIRDEILDCDNLTVLVGANGTGKSSFLRAMELFHAEKPDLTEGDYHGKQTENDIKITVTFGNLSDLVKSEFKDYVLNGEISVTRILKWNDGKVKPTYHGIMLQNPDFTTIYNDISTVAKQKYEDLLKRDIYKDLPKWSSQKKAKEDLRELERRIPDRCEKCLDDGKSFKHGQIFPKFAQFLYIAPVHDAAKDAEEGRNSVLAELMDIVVKSSIAERVGMKKFKESAQKKYHKLMHTYEQNELKKLGEQMSKIVGQFVPGAKVNLSWSDTELTIEPPSSTISLVEDGYDSAVSSAGHGLQRIFIMAILQQLSEAQSDDGADEFPALILAIDEPELYQHPTRQRYMSQKLLALADKSLNSSRGIQILYSTHSPNFFGIDRLDQIRLVRKVKDESGGFRSTRITKTSLKEVADKLTITTGHKKTEDKLRRSLRTIMTHDMTEGVFADVVVLVEGPGDAAVLVAVAKSMKHQLDGLGISVIHCNGKGNIKMSVTIYRLLNIPLYVIWDGDFSNQGSKDENRAILAALGEELQDSPVGVHDTFACLDNNLEDVIKEDLGAKFEAYRKKCMKDLNLPESSNWKKPYIISHLIDVAARKKTQFLKLESVVQKVVKLCQDNTSP